MRIAQVSPLFESVPPKLYGGTERVVSYLTEELVRAGHEVTLFASGDSESKARLIPGSDKALRLDGTSGQEQLRHTAMLKEVYALRNEFDVIHLHIDDWHMQVPRLFDTPHITTVHGRIDTPGRKRLFENRPDLTLVSISNAQRAPIADATWLATVYHGLPKELYVPSAESSDYLVFLGRISPEKRVERAVDIAGRYGMRLKIAAKVDQNDYDYYLSVKHKLEAPWVDFIGEVGEPEKIALLRGAYALVFPIDWPEPFGLAMIEAMLCGAPVIAYRHGSIPEVVDEGITGFVVDGEDAAVAALDRVRGIDRLACAAHAYSRFSAERMASDYARVYKHRAIQFLRDRSVVRSTASLARNDILASVRSDTHAEPGE
jgi:glycosyltransferase involved in cell wall biosynthesis